MTSISQNFMATTSGAGALIALGLGAFGIGLTEFVTMGLLPQVATDLGASLPMAGLLISGYALGVTFGGLLLALLAGRLPHRTVLMLLMMIFTAGNLFCALSPGFALVLIARIVTGFAHGTYFGTGSVVAQALVPPERKASAIAMIFTGLTLATVLGLPFGAWLGQAFATVAPLQARMMAQSPAGADRLGATLNISAFNLGNAIGAWLGGAVLSAGLGLVALMPLAALLPLAALAMAYLPERS